MHYFTTDFADDVTGVTNRNSPMLGSNNVVAVSNISSTTANVLYPVSNLANPATNLFWSGTSTVATERVAVLVPSVECDFVAVQGHNFMTAGIAVTLELATSVDGFGDPIYTTALSIGIPTENSPIVVRFAARVLVAARLVLSPGTSVPRASVVYVGKALILPRRIYVGHTPINMGRVTKVASGRSEVGGFLGRVLIGEGRTNGVSLQNLDPLWYRVYFDPFIERSIEHPFFFAWRPYSYPSEVGYVWLTNDPRPTNQRSNGMMSVDLELGGVP